MLKGYRVKTPETAPFADEDCEICLDCIYRSLKFAALNNCGCKLQKCYYRNYLVTQTVPKYAECISLLKLKLTSALQTICNTDV